ncbi:MAG TPA: VOC family protein [Acidimicrobiia bacterium]|nr:VOC family protein [Acidimicrobiia bacterium]
MKVQVAIDCAEPHRLVAFYAAAFGYEVEHHDAMIRGLLEQGLVTDDDLVEIDGSLAFATAAACSDPAGDLPRLLFQQVPEGKVVKNRVHLDFQMGGAEAREVAVERLLGLGATRLWDGQQGPVHKWVTMADPEGNELCVSD